MHGPMVRSFYWFAVTFFILVVMIMPLGDLITGSIPKYYTSAQLTESAYIPVTIQHSDGALDPAQRKWTVDANLTGYVLYAGEGVHWISDKDFRDCWTRHGYPIDTWYKEPDTVASLTDRECYTLWYHRYYQASKGYDPATAVIVVFGQ